AEHVAAFAPAGDRRRTAAADGDDTPSDDAPPAPSTPAAQSALKAERRVSWSRLSRTRWIALFQHGALRGDAADKIFPRLVERFRSFTLELGGERRIVDAGPREFCEHILGVAAIDRQYALQFAMIGEGVQGLLGHGVDRVRGRERLDIERVGGVRILGAGAGPEQALRPGAGNFQLLPAG